MEINKGLFLDGYVTDKPNGGWQYAKSVLLADGFKSVRVEKGFDQLSSGSSLRDILMSLSPTPLFGITTIKIVGSEFIRDEIIYFVYFVSTTNSTSSAILKYNIPNDAYEIILMESPATNFYFHPDYVVDSMHTFTPDGDLIIAFCNGTDDVCIEPMLMNVNKRNEYYLDNNQIKYLNLLYLFNRTEHIIENVYVLDDGELDPGVYYCSCRFVYIDGTKSNWCMLTQPLKIGADPNKTTGAAINIKGEYSGEYAYKSIDVAYIRKFNGQVYAYEYGNFVISSTYSSGTYTYKFDININSNIGKLVDLDSILIRKAFYRKSTSIDFVTNKVHLAAVKEENLILNYQNFANDIVVGYNTTITDKDDGTKPTFAPGEVYALYIYFILKGSGVIALPFNIPGRADFFFQSGVFDDFENEYSGSFAAAPTILRTFDYSDFPVSGTTIIYIAVELVTYKTGIEVVHTVTTGILNNVNFTTNLRSALNSLFASASISITITSITATSISFSFTSTTVNGTYLRYKILSSIGGTDNTNLYNDVIEINNNYNHIFTGARAVKSFNYMSYWENTVASGKATHHRFPPIKTLAAIVNASHAGTFGVTKGALLGLTLENIVIPSEISDKVRYMGIAYAKRTAENKMFYGDSLTLHYHTVGTTLYGTPFSFLLKDGYNKYADVSPTANTYNKQYVYIDNFDILHNEIKVKITNLIPEYTIEYKDRSFSTWRCTEADKQHIRGTLTDFEFGNIVSATSLSGFSENILIDFNCIIPNNTVFNAGATFEYSKLSSPETRNYLFKPKPVIGTTAMPDVDNIGGQKHIFLYSPSSEDFPITVANFGTLTSAGANLTDTNNDSYAFAIDADETTNPNDGYLYVDEDIKIAISSIYSMKDDVYIDPKSQVIVPCGNPIEITGSGVYDFELTEVGDCVISEKVTLFSNDPFLNAVGNIPTRTSTVTHRDARNKLENHVQSSSLRLGNKIVYTHLTYGISDLSRIYRKDVNDPQSNIYLLEFKGNDAKQHNNYIPPEVLYSNDYNSIQDIDTPLFLKDTPEYNLNKIVRGTNYKNEDLDISALKTFLVDDYYVMPGDKKNIISINRMGDGLIIQQRHGLHYAFIKDYLDLQGKNAYLGTGELFDRKPQELRFGNVDSINCPHILSNTVFKYGYIVFDDYAKRLYLFNGEKISCLSNNNASEYFRRNYNFSGLAYNPLVSTKNGIILTFDGENDNIHIIKKLASGANTNLSFSFLINNFLSFHEWIPSYICQSEDKVFSFGTTGSNSYVKYKHNSISNVSLFYNRTTPNASLIDIIFTGGDDVKDLSKLIENVNWESQAIKISTGANIYDVTFDQILLYNDDQCSSYVTLTNSNWFYKNKRDIVKTWNFNNFRNLVVDNKLAFLTTALEPNANVSSSKNWYNKDVFQGKHIVVRLKTANAISDGTQYKLILNNINVEAKLVRR